MKRIIFFVALICSLSSLNAQVKIKESNNLSIVGKIVAGVSCPNISKDAEGNYYLINNTECDNHNRHVIKLGVTKSALETLNYLKTFIEEKNTGDAFELEDESTQTNYTLYKVRRYGQAGLKIESKNDTQCYGLFFLTNVKKAIKIIEKDQ